MDAYRFDGPKLARTGESLLTAEEHECQGGELKKVELQHCVGLGLCEGVGRLGGEVVPVRGMMGERR